jgi:hypothetical protein
MLEQFASNNQRRHLDIALGLHSLLWNYRVPGTINAAAFDGLEKGFPRLEFITVCLKHLYRTMDEIENVSLPILGWEESEFASL